MASIKEAFPPSLSSTEEEVVLTRPLSGWAVFSLIVSLLSFLAPVSFNLLPLSVFAFALAAIVVLRLRNSESISGWALAVMAMGIALMTGAWTVTARVTQQRHLAVTAENFAAEYLSLLSNGLFYNALELKLPFSQRQPSDVDLQAFYEEFTGELDESYEVFEIMGIDESQPGNLERVRKISLERLKVDPVTMLARNHPDAEWRAVEIQQIASKGRQAVVQLVLSCDQNFDSKVVVTLARYLTEWDQSGKLAEWRITDQKIAQ
jgi:ABC-type multidrug transport system fused ATPase/permease subunit